MLMIGKVCDHLSTVDVVCEKLDESMKLLQDIYSANYSIN